MVQSTSILAAALFILRLHSGFGLLTPPKFGAITTCVIPPTKGTGVSSRYWYIAARTRYNLQSSTRLTQVPPFKSPAPIKWASGLLRRRGYKRLLTIILAAIIAFAPALSPSANAATSIAENGISPASTVLHTSGTLALLLLPALTSAFTTTTAVLSSRVTSSGSSLSHRHRSPKHHFNLASSSGCLEDGYNNSLDLEFEFMPNSWTGDNTDMSPWTSHSSSSCQFLGLLSVFASWLRFVTNVLLSRIVPELLVNNDFLKMSFVILLFLRPLSKVVLSQA